MKVHIVSVGLSLLDALRDPRRSMPGDPCLAAVEKARPQQLLARAHKDSNGETASGWLAAELAGPGGGLLAEMSAKAQSRRWPCKISAELDTFARVPDAGYPLAAADIAVLITSDTADGLLAAVWNAAALVQGDLTRIRYLPEAGQPAALEAGCCVIARVRGLDAGSAAGFCDAMDGLGQLGRNLLDGIAAGGAADLEGFRFYLSGGFKAAIPFLIGLAEGMASLPEAGEVDAFVLHDTAIESGPIRLPLRQLAPEHAWRELDGLTRTPVSARPAGSCDCLRGYAYEKSQEGWRLTAFGVGLKALYRDIRQPGIPV
jgi:hypothetical protein